MEEAKQKPKFVFEPLDAKHDRAAFSCEEPALNKYLKTQASQDVEKNLTAIFVCTPDGTKIAGYYALSQYSVGVDTIPEELARKLTRQKQVPATLIGRLARDTKFAGTGLGETLLMDALRRCVNHSRQIASWAVIVDAKTDTNIAFYRKYGFIELPKIPRSLFLPISTTEKMLVEAGIDVEPGAR